MRLVILDRDGVINHDRVDHVRSVEQWRPIDGSIEAIADLTRAGYTIAVASNQSGVARGYFSLDDVGRMNDRMWSLVRSAGGEIAHVAFCPHGPGDGCACRKPAPGLIDEIAAAVGAPEGGERWMVGDSARDLVAGAARGCRPVLVLTGKGAATAARPESLPAGTRQFRDLRSFADHLLGSGT